MEPYPTVPQAECCHQTVLRTVKARQLVDGRASDSTDQVVCECGKRLLVIQSTQASLECSVCGHRVGALRNHRGGIEYPNGGVLHNCSEDSCNRDRWFSLVPLPPHPERDYSGEPPGPEPPEWLKRIAGAFGPDGGDSPEPEPTPGR